MLKSIAEVNREIAEGKALLLAGSEEALSQLSRGNWIGGTIPYFMDGDSALCCESRILVSELPEGAVLTAIREYTMESLHRICSDAPENGVTFLIMPAASAVHAAYAADAPAYDGFLSRPIVGWVSGVHLSKLGQQQPKVVNGRTCVASCDTALAMHVALPEGKLAVLDIVNVFQPGQGDTLTFPKTGFKVTDCEVNGKPENFAAYIARTGQDLQVPLTASYNGSIVNVSVQNVDKVRGVVHLYAPVFPGMEYKFGAPVADYVGALQQAVGEHQESAEFSCNCILNYMYAGLEGKKTGNITGPITFGEIAHQLLNQTIVQLHIRDLN